MRLVEKRDSFGKTCLMRIIWIDLFNETRLERLVNINFDTKLRDSFGKLDLLGKRDSFVKPDSLHQTCS